MQVFLQCVILIVILIFIFHIITFSVDYINLNKQLKTFFDKKYDMESTLDRWANAEKQFQKDEESE